jgi:putative DNA primase/helicase
MNPSNRENSSLPKITSYSVRDFIEMELPERKDLLQPWLPEQGLAMIHAPRGVGKTFFALSCAYVIGTGGEFLKFKAPEAKSVLYLDGEMPATAMQKRLRQLMFSNALVNIVTPDMQARDQGLINLGDPAYQKALKPDIEEASLIIVDNISTLVRGGKENEAESWLPIQEWALKLRSNGKSVLFIHHSGKDGRQRGTSRREDVLDTVISLRQPGTYDPEQGAVFQVHFEKARGFTGAEAKPFEARLETDAENRLIWTYSSIEDSTYDRVCKLANEGLEQHEIAEELNLHKSSVSRHVKHGKRIGDISSKD